ncbi:MAG: hypothetical protein K2Q26_09190 [Bdellovibrionales bacterium]|nr:hypothetical protein [Bdellovibrionales bacterium]
MKPSLLRQQIELFALSLGAGVAIIAMSSFLTDLYGAKHIAIGVVLGQASWLFNGLSSWFLFTKKHIAWIVMVNVIKYVILVTIIVAIIARLNAPLVGVGLFLHIVATSLAWYAFKVRN